MTRDSQRDWASFDPESIPTKVDVPELEAFLADVGRKGSLLDLGCGNGGLSRALAARGYHVTAVDINAGAIASARESAVSFHVRDILSTDGLNLSAAPFSIVVCQLVISLVGGVAERARLLQNAHDSLEPGGWLYLSASGISDDINPGYARLYDEDFAETGEHGTYFSRDSAGNILYATHHFTEPELRALLEASGLEVSRLTVKKEASSRRSDEAARFLYAVARKPEIVANAFLERSR